MRVLLQGGHLPGHVVSKAGIRTDPSKIEVVLNWPEPNTMKEV